MLLVIIIFSSRVAPGSWTLVSLSCPASSFLFCSISMLRALHPMIVPRDIFGQVSLW